MAKLRFTGPEGAAFCGATLRLITLEDADIDIIDELQRETGASMEDVIEWFDPKKKRAKGAAAIFYFTLRNAGMFVTFKESWALFRGGEYEQVEEPAPKKAKADADPTSAPTDSVRGSASGKGKAKAKARTGQPKPEKTSATPSSPAS